MVGAGEALAAHCLPSLPALPMPLVLIAGGLLLIAVGSVQQGSVGSQKSQSNRPTRHPWRGTREPIVKQGRMGEAWCGQH